MVLLNLLVILLKLKWKNLHLFLLIHLILEYLHKMLLDLILIVKDFGILIVLILK